MLSLPLGPQAAQWLQSGNGWSCTTSGASGASGGPGRLHQQTMIRVQDHSARKPLSVSEFNTLVKQLVEPQFIDVQVKGEVSGLRMQAKGHLWFSIKDQGAALGAVIWAGTTRRLAMQPEEGKSYVFTGSLDLYVPSGQLKFIVSTLEFDDIGQIREEIERLKRLLEAEGALAPERKRKLPLIPRCVALVTSPTGKVIHDLQQTIWDRFPNMAIVVYPAAVQGVSSQSSVVTAIRQANREGLADVLVVARGGGSLEELMAFNTAPVARAILNSNIPVVTALGHTSDRTVADLVADLECRTPTEAGARVVPVKKELEDRLEDRRHRLRMAADRLIQPQQDHLRRCRDSLRREMRRSYEDRQLRLSRLAAELNRLSPLNQIGQRRKLLDMHQRHLSRAADDFMQAHGAHLSRAQGALGAAHRRCVQDQSRGRRRLGQLVAALDQALAATLASRSQHLEAQSRSLAAIDPNAVLARGFSICYSGSTTRIVRRSTEVEPGDQIQVLLAAGRLIAEVNSRQ